MSERSESPSTVGKLLSKTRSRNRKNGDSATNSVHSDKNEGHGLRASIDNTIDKLKGHTGSDDEGKAGIKKLVPKVLVPKRKRRQQEEEMRASEEAAAEAARGRSVAERGTLRNNSNTPSNGSNDASSLLTYEESDGESFTSISPADKRGSKIFH
ncbi:hypothetical protein M7I_1737 [Glarea lozoyensis 74030]|uniref:Uncharacterized protein n=1 Tax=Glarea lozoyensis (strain ATCC 74030 / MF5533) TaxID=1104152 RepID=H0EH04_GLAL7|nr:hypothetical protein M7I_1737 [Glarea lozoyensis 74030]